MLFIGQNDAMDCGRVLGSGGQDYGLSPELEQICEEWALGKGGSFFVGYSLRCLNSPSTTLNCWGRI